MLVREREGVENTRERAISRGKIDLCAALPAFPVCVHLFRGLKICESCTELGCQGRCGLLATGQARIMASQMPSISRQEANTLVRQVQSTQLINRQLSSVCQVNGLKSTGVKAELQRRIINRESEIYQYAISHSCQTRAFF